MKYDLFTTLVNNYFGDIDNICFYQSFFKDVDIVPNAIELTNLSEKNIGERMLITTVTSKGIILNFFLGTTYEEGEYRQNLFGLYYIYNGDYYFLRNFACDNQGNPKCLLDLYSEGQLEFLKNNVSSDKSYVEPKEFAKSKMMPQKTILIDSTNLRYYETLSDNYDLFQVIDVIAHDGKVRTNKND